MFGGRFNRPGITALYLAGDPVTALAEYVQGAPYTLPGTLVAYQTEIDGVIELDEAERPGASCDWKFLAASSNGPRQAG